MTADRVIPPTAAWPAAKKLIVIGASAGAVDALSAILPTLPAGYPFPILVVIHVPPDRASALPDIFAKKSRLNVKEAEDKEPLCAGTVYFAPPDYHLLVEPDGRTSRGAEAALRSLEIAGRATWLMRAYRRTPLFARGCELAYRFVARHRKAFDRIERALGGVKG